MTFRASAEKALRSWIDSGAEDAFKDFVKDEWGNEDGNADYLADGFVESDDFYKFRTMLIAELATFIEENVVSEVRFVN